MENMSPRPRIGPAPSSPGSESGGELAHAEATGEGGSTDLVLKGRPTNEVRAMRWGQALELRAEGMSFQQIGDEMKLSRSAAYELVKRGLDDYVGEPAAEVRRLEELRLERLHQVVWPKALAGHGESIDRLLRLMDRRAKLLGLDAPAELDIRELRAVVLGRIQEALDPETYDKLIQALNR